MKHKSDGRKEHAARVKRALKGHKYASGGPIPVSSIGQDHGPLTVEQLERALGLRNAKNATSIDAANKAGSSSQYKHGGRP